MNVIYALNLISRWVLFGVSTYKAYKERSCGWLLISTAFFLAATAPERLLLEPLGLELVHEVAFVVDMLGTLMQGVLLFLAANYLRASLSLRGLAAGLIMGMIGYLWVVITNMGSLNLSFTVKTLVPLIVYAIGYLSMGIILYRHVIERKTGELLFPLGMIALGALNLSYPVTATWNWFIPYGFLLGTIFRIMMALGALTLVLWPFGISKPKAGPKAEAGAFIFQDRSGALKFLGDRRDISGMLVITRKDPEILKRELHPDSMVFWVTRVSEGMISETPKIYAISPTKIDIMTDLISKALEQGYGVVFIDATEYLILENGFEKAFKFLLNVKDRVMIHGGTMIVVVALAALTESQMRLFTREFRRE